MGRSKSQKFYTDKKSLPFLDLKLVYAHLELKLSKKLFVDSLLILFDRMSISKMDKFLYYLWLSECFVLFMLDLLKVVTCPGTIWTVQWSQYARINFRAHFNLF